MILHGYRNRYGAATFRTAQEATPWLIATIEMPGSVARRGRVHGIDLAYADVGAAAALTSVTLVKMTATLPTGGTAITSTNLGPRAGGAASAIVRGSTASDAGAATAITATVASRIRSAMFGQFTAAVQPVAQNWDIWRPDRDPALELAPGDSYGLIVITASVAAEAQMVASFVWSEG